MTIFARLSIVGVAVLAFTGWSIVRFRRHRTVSARLQVVGAGCLVIVVLTHVAEAFRLFPRMSWGNSQSVGHYLDLTSAVIGITLLGVAMLLWKTGGRS